jgi:large subunit ribosomal protein L35Ae
MSREPFSDTEGKVIFCGGGDFPLTRAFSRFRRGFTNTYHHTALLSLEGVNDTAGSKFYHGKRVAYIYKAQKTVSGSKFRVVWGKITRAHGTNGVVRAKFATNLPVSELSGHIH